MKIIPSVILFAAVSANCMAATVADSTVHRLGDVVVTGSRYKTDLRHLPVTISVVDGQTLREKYRDNILPTLTEQVPGLFVTSRGMLGYGVSTGAAGKVQDASQLWQNLPNQDDFLESMAAAAQAVHEYFDHGKNIIYINVMNNMSVDCDCDSHPADPKLKDMGILASTDPVALDQACLDLVFNHKAQPGDDEKPLIERINRQHGTYITDYAEKIGLGSKKYKIVMVK